MYPIRKISTQDKLKNFAASALENTVVVGAGAGIAILAIAGIIILYLAIYAFYGLITGILVYFAWNALVPALLGGTTITFTQGFWIGIVLSFLSSVFKMVVNVKKD